MGLGGRLPARHRPPAARELLRHQAVVVLHPDAAVVGAGRRAVERSTSTAATRSAPCWRRSCARPTSTRAPAWSSRRSSSWSGCCAPPTSPSPATAGRGCRSNAGQKLFYPPDVSGWDDTRWLDTIDHGRPLAARQRASWRTTPSSRAATTPTETRSGGARRAAGCSGMTPTLTDETVTRPHRLGRHRHPRGCQRVDARPARQRPADAHRDVPRPPHLMTATSCSCDEFYRAALLRGAAAQAGAGLPAIERGMPTPAGTGLSRRSFLARSAGLALAVYGGVDARAARLRGGHRRRAWPPGAEQNILVSIFLPGGLDALSLIAPASDSDVPVAAARRSPSGAEDAVAASRRATRRCSGTPTRAPLRDLHKRGQGHRAAGDRLHGPEPVALHLAPLLGGRRARPVRPRRLDGPLPRPPRRAPTTRSRACRSDWTPVAVARAALRPRRRGRPTRATTTSGRRDVWDDERQRQAADGLGRARATCRRPTPQLAARPQRGADVDVAAHAASRRCRGIDPLEAPTCRTRRPTTRSRAGWPRSPR